MGCPHLRPESPGAHGQSTPSITLVATQLGLGPIQRQLGEPHSQERAGLGPPALHKSRRQPVLWMSPCQYTYPDHPPALFPTAPSPGARTEVSRSQACWQFQPVPPYRSAGPPSPTSCLHLHWSPGSTGERSRVSTGPPAASLHTAAGPPDAGPHFLQTTTSPRGPVVWCQGHDVFLPGT